VVEFAVRIPNTPVRLLYVSGHTVERAVSPIFVATVDEREEREPDRDVKLVERLATVHESELRFVERILTVPERDTRLLFTAPIVPERVARLELVVLRLLFVVPSEPERVARLPESVLIFVV